MLYDFLYKREEGLASPAIIIAPIAVLSENSRLESIAIYQTAAKKQNGAIFSCFTADIMSTQLRYLLFALLRSSGRHLRHTVQTN